MVKKIAFTKMTGAGNDFLIIDAQNGLNYRELAQKACDRTCGIGADGILVFDKSSKADYRMRIINADGSEAEMCGNGARCMAVYIVRHKHCLKKLFSMETLAGIIMAEAAGETASVRLSDPVDYQPKIPLSLDGRKIQVHYMDTGVPHVVIYVDQLEHIPVKAIGHKVRFHKKFLPRGANINFVEQLKPGLIAVRTYERGVEDETRACGTGSVASALISYLHAHPEVTDKKDAHMSVLTVSGETLQVSFAITGTNISEVWLRGSAKFIAQGEYYYKKGREA